MTRREFHRTLGAASTGAALLPLLDCGKNSSSALITALDVAEVAATAAVPLITAFSAQLGPFAPVAIAYAKAISDAAARSITELKSTDPPALQYSTIAGYFAEVLAISIPAGTVSEVVAVISAISVAVQAILAIVNNTPAAQIKKAAAAVPPDVKALLVKYQAQVKALGSDQARMQDVLTRAAQLRK
jgi:hypothetical protein